MDTDEKKIQLLNSKEIPFYEPNLLNLVEKNMRAGKLQFTTDFEAAISDAEVIFICVGTPSLENGLPDEKYLWNVIRSLINAWKKTPKKNLRVIATKSTVPIGTGKKIVDLLNQSDLDENYFSVVSNPEFLREGSAIQDFFKPDRTVIGGSSDAAIQKVASIFKSIYRNESPIVKTSLETAEVIKYASNGFLATKITFINEIANLCDQVGADVRDVAQAMGSDGRIGKYFLHPGPGFGGSCFPKDTLALKKMGDLNGIDLKIVGAVIEANKNQTKIVLDKVRTVLENNFKNKVISILGITFKPNTDDLRDSPAIEVLKCLLQTEAQVKIHDPIGLPGLKEIFNDRVEYAEKIDECLKNSDVLVTLTEWNDYRNLDFVEIKKIMRSHNVVDARNIFEPAVVKENGFKYLGIGRQ